MTNLNYLKHLGIVLPPIEEPDSTLKGSDIISKIRAFYLRIENTKIENKECFPGFFLELLHDYPNSMCDYHVNDVLGLLIALFYHESHPTEEYQQKHSDPWPGYSLDDLSELFDRSKQTIAKAIGDKSAEAQQLLRHPSLAAEAKEIALRELIEAEKQKLLEERDKKTK